MLNKDIITTVLFDYDDTLGNREKAAYDCYYEMIQNCIHTDDSLLLESIVQDCMIFDQKGNVNKQYVKEQIEKKYKIQLPKDFPAYWAEHLPQHSVLIPHALETLDYLKMRYQLGIITNGKSREQRNKIQQTKLDTIFDMEKIVVSGDYLFQKPDKRIFQVACENYQVQPEQCVYIGDIFTNDILGALNSGMQAIWMWNQGNRQCHYPIPIIHQIEELMKLL